MPDYLIKSTIFFQALFSSYFHRMTMLLNSLKKYVMKTEWLCSPFEFA